MTWKVLVKVISMHLLYCDFFYSSYDESLWQKINVYYKKVPGDFIVHVLTKGKIIYPMYYKYWTEKELLEKKITIKVIILSFLSQKK